MKGLLKLLAHQRAPLTAIVSAAAVAAIQSYHEGHIDWPVVALAALTTLATYLHSPAAVAIVEALGCKIVPSHSLPTGLAFRAPDEARQLTAVARGTFAIPVNDEPGGKPE